MKRIGKVLSVSLIFCVVLSLPVFSQTTSGNMAWPAANKQMTMLIPFGAGGLSDIVARKVGEIISKQNGWNIIYVNKTGATGAVAYSFLAASHPDGYIISYFSGELCMIKALGYTNDIIPSNFRLLCQSQEAPAAITVNAKSNFKTIKDFVTYAKANPGKIRSGDCGPASGWYLGAKKLEDAAGIKLNHVSYAGAADAVVALMGNHIDDVSVSIMEAKTAIDSGELRPIAVMSEKRDQNYPDVPTLRESGYDVLQSAWGGFMVPKNTPDNVVAILEDAFARAIQSDDFKKLAQERSFNVNYKTGAEVTKFAEKEYAYYSEVLPGLIK